MLWKLLGWQKKLDALFDDGWVVLGVTSRLTRVRTNEALVVDGHGCATMRPEQTTQDSTYCVRLGSRLS